MRSRFHIVFISVMLGCAACTGPGVVGESRGGFSGFTDEFRDRFTAVVVEADFQPRVLGDRSVTRAELVQAYSRLFTCLRQGRASGEVWIDLDLEPSISLSVAVPEADGSFPPDGTRASALTTELLRVCQGSYIDLIERAYARQHPDTAALAARKKSLVLACAARLLPQAEVSTAWPVDRIRSTLLRFAEAGDGETMTRARRCAERYGIPDQDLAVVTPR